ncbi:hypothetical protein HHK36_024410 [Tetracentron sinense]|uniref:Prolyl endopeptidase n=1 Tax=Tetracentron sinense TaxID=13715 RepID=A0A834YK78_TETSI|nr:hypothetical protein HHK36_024410 [Tetracentron sinense]
MASLAILTRRISISNAMSIRRCSLPLSFRLLPHISSSFFSSHCKGNLFSSPSQRPPVPKKIPFKVSAHGRKWEDPYHWMSEADDPDFSNYLNQENSYTQAFMADTQILQRKLLSEMTSRMPPKISTPPERWGPWLYYQYIPEGKEYPVLCRRLETDKNGGVKALLNYYMDPLNLIEVPLLSQHGYVHVGTCRVSPDHKFLAYTLDITGSECFMLQIKDLITGGVLPKSRVDGVVSLAWAQDGCTLFYTVSDKTQRPYRVLCTRLGSDAVDTAPIYTESESSCCVDITSTKDGKFITVYVIDSASPRDGLQRIRKRVPGVQYFLEHHYGFFYILTNAPLREDEDMVGRSYYLVRCRAGDIQSADWQEIILPGEDVNFQDMDIFDGHLVLFLDKRGSPMICSISMPIDVNCKNPMKVDDLNPWYFPLPSNSCRIVPGSNHDFMMSNYRVVLSSPVMPDVIADFDMSKQKFSIVHQEEVVGVSSNTGPSWLACNVHTNKLLCTQTHNDQNVHNTEVQSWKDISDAFSCEKKEVISHDGVRVPLTILYSRETQQKGQSPGILHGYGAYGEVLDKSWCSDRLSLLDRGWVVAFADVRGGGGGDSSWHKAGSGPYKLNSIYDFVACGKYLVNEGFVHKDQLGAIGFSAGCLLVGAAINMYPDLFRASILKVPFLDICNTLLDPSLPLTILDYEEFGDPRIQTHFESIFSYSPYDNIPPGVCHPSMLVTIRDTIRVGSMEVLYLVARVWMLTCTGSSVGSGLDLNMQLNHNSECGPFRKAKLATFDHIFGYNVLGSNLNFFL